MRRLLWRGLIILTAFSFLTACNPDEKNKDEIFEKANASAVDYVRTVEKREFVVEKTELTSAVGGGTVFVTGHYKDDDKNKWSIAVNSKTFEVNSIGGVTK